MRLKKAPKTKAAKKAEWNARQKRANAEWTPHDPAWGRYQTGVGVLRDRRLGGMKEHFVKLSGGRADGNG